MVEIQSYEKSYQKNIDLMMHEIGSEFLLPISNGRKSNKVVLDGYWVALYENELIGTIGVLSIDKNATVLKNMFVKKEFRGRKYKTAELLLNKLTHWLNEQGKSVIYLGTMNQFKAAQRFYEKNKFIQIDKKELPENFICNPIDDVFYKKELSPIL